MNCPERKADTNSRMLNTMLRYFESVKLFVVS